MTTERLEAGRELDALVAVEVMGWTQDGLVAYVDDDPGWRDAHGVEVALLLPPWSTSGACLEVLERMRDLGRAIEIIWEPDGYEWLVKFSGALGDEAPTLPHAICLAALEAVRAEVGVHPVLSGSVTGVMPPLTGSVTGVMPPLRAKE